MLLKNIIESLISLNDMIYIINIIKSKTALNKFYLSFLWISSLEYYKFRSITIDKKMSFFLKNFNV